MNVFSILRAAGRQVTAADTGLPVRYWRWLWVAMAIRVLLGLPLFLVLLVPYYACYWFVQGVDKLGGLLLKTYQWCLETDVRRSGWKPEKRLAGPVVINPAWKVTVSREFTDC